MKLLEENAKLQKALIDAQAKQLDSQAKQLELMSQGTPEQAQTPQISKEEEWRALNTPSQGFGRSKLPTNKSSSPPPGLPGNVTATGVPEIATTHGIKLVPINVIRKSPRLLEFPLYWHVLSPFRLRSCH